MSLPLLTVPFRPSVQDGAHGLSGLGWLRPAQCHSAPAYPQGISELISGAADVAHVGMGGVQFFEHLLTERLKVFLAGHGALNQYCKVFYGGDFLGHICSV